MQWKLFEPEHERTYFCPGSSKARASLGVAMVAAPLAPTMVLPPVAQIKRETKTK